MASNTTNGEAKEIRDNLFVQKNDSNANPNKGAGNMKSTGAIPKAKPGGGSVPNGIGAEVRVKLNNNVNDNTPKLDLNGTEPYANADAHENNESRTFAKPLTNGFKHNGLSCTNSSSSGSECAASTSRAFPNIRPTPPKDSESECSSDTGNDDLSCSDECCIYTYKGDAADLPRSFLHLDTAEPHDGHDQSRVGSRGSSPEMDFLEMDFDPGPSCDADSDASSLHSELRNDDNAHDNDSLEQGPQEGPPPAPIDRYSPSPEADTPPENNLSAENAPVAHCPEPEPQSEQIVEVEAVANVVDEPWLPKERWQRTLGALVLREPKGYHSSSGDLWSPSEAATPSTSALDTRVNTSSSLHHSAMEKQLVLDKPAAPGEEPTPPVPKTMIWSEQEAAFKQITQIGTSACGATAVLNALAALGQPVPTHEQAIAAVTTRARANSSPLVPYLVSRSTAGSTHHDLIAGLTKLSEGRVYARFFHMYPERYINLSLWLSYWIARGAVPIATLNLQRGVRVGEPLPDAWHHQMIFGVGPHGVYLTNPLERVEEGVLWHQLSSESVLLVRREDVTSRWTSLTNLRELMHMKDARWHHLNVLGQVANVVREHQLLVRAHAVSRTHVCLPAAYASGVTVCADAAGPAADLLRHCPELPLLKP